jgi:hypothetical protein
MTPSRQGGVETKLRKRELNPSLRPSRTHLVSVTNLCQDKIALPNQT